MLSLLLLCLSRSPTSSFLMSTLASPRRLDGASPFFISLLDPRTGRKRPLTDPPDNIVGCVEFAASFPIGTDGGEAPDFDPRYCDGDPVEDVELLVNISNNMMGNTICAFADGTAMPMLGMVQKFREEFMEAASGGVPDGVRHDASVRAMLEGRA